MTKFVAYLNPVNSAMCLSVSKVIDGVKQIIISGWTVGVTGYTICQQQTQFTAEQARDYMYNWYLSQGYEDAPVPLLANIEIFDMTGSSQLGLPFVPLTGSAPSSGPTQFSTVRAILGSIMVVPPTPDLLPILNSTCQPMLVLPPLPTIAPYGLGVPVYKCNRVCGGQ